MNSQHLIAGNHREQALASMSEGRLDLLVVGGGIVGAGVARDSAMRGLRVALIEQNDFASGTSSRSSRLLHGGLRYLAQGRLGLVREASVEKRVLHEIAPHLAQPLPFIFPTYSKTEWPLWKLRIGVKLYDLLCGGGNLGKSRGMSRDEVLSMLPEMKASGLTGAVRYFDGLTNDARLVLDTLGSAARHGAGVLNYCRFVAASREASAWRCETEDTLAGRGCVIRARTVVNATGPWAGALPHSQVHLRLTKGIHMVVEQRRLPVREAVVLTEGKRILFAIPWGERVILGTTDTDYQGSLDELYAEPEDLTYVLGIVNESFPKARLTDEDIVSAWAGVRPLIANPNGSPSDISRSHQIRQPEPGWWDVAGGKLTTYRLMAEQTVDQIVRHLGRAAAPCKTGVERLLETTDSRGANSRPAAQPLDFSGIVPPPVNYGIVEHCVAKEWAVHLDDVMLRRAGWSYYHRDSEPIAARVADWMGGLLGWTPEARASEVKRYARAAGWRSHERDSNDVAISAK